MADLDGLLNRLARIQVSSLCDADKSLSPLPSTLHPMVSQATLVGPAIVVVAEDDHLPTYIAVNDAPPGSVIVVATNDAPGHKAVFGELFANEARRIGIRGVIVDGYVRDLRGLQKVGMPVWARGTNPASGTMRKFPTHTDEVDEVVVFGQKVRTGDIVFADDDGVLIASREKIERALLLAEEIEEKEAAVVRGLAGGIPLSKLTNVQQYIEGLRSGDEIPFQFTV